MDDRESLARRFEHHRPRLRGVALRLLGSVDEAEDAVQEAWIRLSRADVDSIENLEAWLVTTVGRIALNMLRGRRTRREQPLSSALPSDLSLASGDVDPQAEADLADSVGLALLVVLETMTPAERLSFVLHDLFSVPFEEVGVILDRSPESARQLASRGRRRLRNAERPGVDRSGTGADTEVVRAFLAAARLGDFRALLAVLHPDVVQRVTDDEGLRAQVRGAEEVATRARGFTTTWPDVVVRLARVDGAPGLASYRDDHLVTVLRLEIRDRLITAMHVMTGAAEMAGADLELLDEPAIPVRPLP